MRFNDPIAEQTWREEFARSAELRREFDGDENVYLAFRRNEWRSRSYRMGGQATAEQADDGSTATMAEVARGASLPHPVPARDHVFVDEMSRMLGVPRGLLIRARGQHALSAAGLHRASDLLHVGGPQYRRRDIERVLRDPALLARLRRDAR